MTFLAEVGRARAMAIGVVAALLFALIGVAMPTPADAAVPVTVVDDDGIGSPDCGFGQGVATDATIQDGVNGVDAGGTVYVWGVSGVLCKGRGSWCVSFLVDGGLEVEGYLAGEVDGELV